MDLRKNNLGLSKVAITLGRDDSQATQPSYFSADSVRRAAAVAALALLSLASQNVVAQDKPAAGGLEIAEIEGSLMAMVGDRIKLKTEDDKEVIVVMGSRTTLTYTGTADLKFLMPGMFVRFTAPFDQQRMPAAEVQAIEIFRPVTQRRMTLEQRQEQTPGVYPVVEDKRAAAKKGDSKQKGSDQPSSDVKAAPPGAVNYRIVGQLRGIQSGKLQVLAARLPIQVTLAAEASVTVAAGDTTFCKQGDAVVVNGLRNSQEPNLIEAQAVEITGAKPLGADQEQQPAKAVDPSKPRRGKLGDDKQ